MTQNEWQDIASAPRGVSLQMRGFIVIQPALEPWPTRLWTVRNLAIFVYARWSCWSVGIEILGYGAAVNIGPFMIGACRIKQQMAAFEARLISPLPRSPNNDPE